MTLGNKIKVLRNKKGLTQKDLSEQLNVSFQTVSKWENDENEPDVNTIRQLAKLFDVSTDYLLSEEEKDNDVEPQKEVVTKTIIIHQNALHKCTRCGEDIPEDQLVSVDNTKQERYGRSLYRTVVTGQSYYHRKCLTDKLEAERKRQIELEKAKVSKIKKLSFGWGIAGGIVAFVIALVSFLLIPLHPAISILLALVLGYGIFAMLYCIITQSYIANMFFWVLDHSLKLPGLIFSWSIEGFVWLIAMKILFAIIGFLFGLFLFTFAVGLSALFAIFSFPFIFIHNIHTDYKDAL